MFEEVNELNLSTDVKKVVDSITWPSAGDDSLQQNCESIIHFVLEQSLAYSCGAGLLRTHVIPLIELSMWKLTVAVGLTESCGWGKVDKISETKKYKIPSISDLLVKKIEKRVPKLKSELVEMMPSLPLLYGLYSSVLQFCLYQHLKEKTYSAPLIQDSFSTATVFPCLPEKSRTFPEWLQLSPSQRALLLLEGSSLDEDDKLSFLPSILAKAFGRADFCPSTRYISPFSPACPSPAAELERWVASIEQGGAKSEAFISSMLLLLPPQTAVEEDSCLTGNEAALAWVMRRVGLGLWATAMTPSDVVVLGVFGERVAAFVNTPASSETEPSEETAGDSWVSAHQRTLALPVTPHPSSGVSEFSAASFWRTLLTAGLAVVLQSQAAQKGQLKGVEGEEEEKVEAHGGCCVSSLSLMRLVLLVTHGKVAALQSIPTEDKTKQTAFTVSNLVPSARAPPLGLVFLEVEALLEAMPSRSYKCPQMVPASLKGLFDFLMCELDNLQRQVHIFDALLAVFRKSIRDKQSAAEGAKRSIMRRVLALRRLGEKISTEEGEEGVDSTLEKMAIVPGFSGPLTLLGLKLTLPAIAACTHDAAACTALVDLLRLTFRRNITRQSDFMGRMASLKSLGQLQLFAPLHAATMSRLVCELSLEKALAGMRESGTQLAPGGWIGSDTMDLDRQTEAAVGVFASQIDEWVGREEASAPHHDSALPLVYSPALTPVLASSTLEGVAGGSEEWVEEFCQSLSAASRVSARLMRTGLHLLSSLGHFDRQPPKAHIARRAQAASRISSVLRGVRRDGWALQKLIAALPLCGAMEGLLAFPSPPAEQVDVATQSDLYASFALYHRLNVSNAALMTLVPIEKVLGQAENVEEQAARLPYLLGGEAVLLRHLLDLIAMLTTLRTARQLVGAALDAERTHRLAKPTPEEVAVDYGDKRGFTSFTSMLGSVAKNAINKASANFNKMAHQVRSLHAGGEFVVEPSPNPSALPAQAESLPLLAASLHDHAEIPVFPAACAIPTRLCPLASTILVRDLLISAPFCMGEDAGFARLVTALSPQVVFKLGVEDEKGDKMSVLPEEIAVQAVGSVEIRHKHLWIRTLFFRALTAIRLGKIRLAAGLVERLRGLQGADWPQGDGCDWWRLAAAVATAGCQALCPVELGRSSALIGRLLRAVKSLPDDASAGDVYGTILQASGVRVFEWPVAMLLALPATKAQAVGALKELKIDQIDENETLEVGEIGALWQMALRGAGDQGVAAVEAAAERGLLAVQKMKAGLLN